MRWVFSPYASSLTLACLISSQNLYTHIFRLRFARTCMKKAVLMCNIPALVLPFLWELHCHKLCRSLLHSSFSQGQQECLLVHILTVIQSVIPNLHCGQFSCSCVGTLGRKVSELSAPVFCQAHSPLPQRLLPAVLETLAFLVAEKSLKTWNLTVF